MPLARPVNKVAPPQKVIRALVSHRSTNPQELSYQKGDFWYVTSERDGWYEALSRSCLINRVVEAISDNEDPLTGSRGLVPKQDFEEFNKGGVSGNRTRPSSQEGRCVSCHNTSEGFLKLIVVARIPHHRRICRRTVIPNLHRRKSCPHLPSLRRSNINRELDMRLIRAQLMYRLYAKVIYDFIAERPDELDAKAGDAIVIIAQSNHEWCVCDH
jgi:bud emergence protein 1